MLARRAVEDLAAKRVPFVGDGRRKVGQVDPLQVPEEFFERLFRQGDLALDESFGFGSEDLHPLRRAHELGDGLVLQILEGLQCGRGRQ